jgi:hypothetical protein
MTQLSFNTIAEYMYPFWILGALVIIATVCAGQKNLLRIEIKPILKWCSFLILITGIRIFLLKSAGYVGLTGTPTGLMAIPWVASFTVFWEDICHSLPLVILNDLIGTTRKWARVVNQIALFTVSVSFGLSHLYQGIVVSAILCFYVPYSIKYGKKYGFGTVIVCHTLFDLVTFLFIKYFMGA